MIIAYHAVFTTYGTWLPNDPRGSFSQEVYVAELRRLGPAEYGRQDPQPSAARLRRFRTAARPNLSRPPFFIDDATRPLAGAAFGEVAERLRLDVPACAIMNDHVHLLVMRSGHRIEYLVGQFKGAATRVLGLTESPWTRKCGRIFINSRSALYAAARYIERNPIVARLRPQKWSFVTPLAPADEW